MMLASRPRERESGEVGKFIRHTAGNSKGQRSQVSEVQVAGLGWCGTERDSPRSLLLSMHGSTSLLWSRQINTTQADEKRTETKKMREARQDPSLTVSRCAVGSALSSSPLSSISSSLGT